MKSGKWTMTYIVDKMTDEASVRAVSVAEGEQARYQSTFVCKPGGPELTIVTFDKGRDDGKGVPWDIVGPVGDGNKFMRIRINSDPAIRTILVQQGYINQGQVIPPDEVLPKISRSTRLVFADVFPDDQIGCSSGESASCLHPRVDFTPA